MKKTRILIFPLVAIGLFFILVNGCKKDDNIKVPVILFNPLITYGSMTDQDDNTYKTVNIGSQTWMAENLRTTKYRDGSAIPEVTGDVEWCALTTGAYCNYNNKVTTDAIASYGRLYNWNAVSDSRNLAPTGWHIPTDTEWSQLTDYLGGESEAGGKLKEAGATHWLSPNTGATNETGFSAIPGGHRDCYMAFSGIGNYGRWWSTTEFKADSVWYRYMYSFESSVEKSEVNYKRIGFSIRCVKD